MAPIPLGGDVFTNAERTHRGALSVNLIDIRQSSGKGVRRDLIPEFIAKICSFLTSAADLSAGISCKDDMGVKLGSMEMKRVAHR
jgi:hypothetical protein